MPCGIKDIKLAITPPAWTVTIRITGKPDSKLWLERNTDMINSVLQQMVHRFIPYFYMKFVKKMLSYLYRTLFQIGTGSA
jgi:hypothetical protein